MPNIDLKHRKKIKLNAEKTKTVYSGRRYVKQIKIMIFQ